MSKPTANYLIQSLAACVLLAMLQGCGHFEPIDQTDTFASASGEGLSFFDESGQEITSSSVYGVSNVIFAGHSLGPSPYLLNQEVCKKLAFLGWQVDGISESQLKVNGRKESVSFSEAIELPTKNILIVGGMLGHAKGEQPLDLTWIVDPRKKTIREGPKLGAGRYNLCLTLLNDGNVLITGGSISYSVSSALIELFDSRTEHISVLGQMRLCRSNHSAIQLKDGRVLIVGGELPRYQETDTAEIFDLTSKKSYFVGRLIQPKNCPQLMLYGQNKVVVFGGYTDKSSNGPPLAEVFTARQAARGSQ